MSQRPCHYLGIKWRYFITYHVPCHGSWPALGERPFLLLWASIRCLLWKRKTQEPHSGFWVTPSFACASAPCQQALSRSCCPPPQSIHSPSVLLASPHSLSWASVGFGPWWLSGFQKRRWSCFSLSPRPVLWETLELRWPFDAFQAALKRSDFVPLSAGYWLLLRQGGSLCSQTLPGEDCSPQLTGLMFQHPSCVGGGDTKVSKASFYWSFWIIVIENHWILAS